MGNIITHRYRTADHSIPWDVIQNDIDLLSCFNSLRQEISLFEFADIRLLRIYHR